MVAEAGFEPTVLYFLCGENTAVGSAALTVRRTVIHYRLTLRFIRPRAHTPRSGTAKIKKPLLKRMAFWLRRLDLNQRPSGYEPDELPGCSTPRYLRHRFFGALLLYTKTELFASVFLKKSKTICMCYNDV